jgi:hypothetical protein
MQMDGWRQLDDLLSGRPDWRLEHDGRAPTWRFGQEGASRLVIGFDVDHFVIYSANTDDEYQVRSIESVKRWLELHEAGHAGLTELQKEVGGYLLASEAEQWLNELQDGH